MNFVNELSLSEIESVFYEARIVLVKCRAEENFVPFFVSSNIHQILGFERYQFEEKGDKWLEQVNPNDRNHLLETFQDVLSKEYGECQYRFRTRDEREIWLWQKMKLVRDNAGNPKSIWNLIQDITDFRKNMKKNLQINNRKLDSGFDLIGKESSQEFDSSHLSLRLQEWVVKRSLELGEKLEHQKKIENKLRKRLLFEYALTRASILLLGDDSNEAFEEALNILLEVTDSDRIYICKNYIGKGGFLYARRIHEVNREPAEPLIDNSAFQEILYEDIPWLYDNLSNDKIIYGNSDDLPSPEWEMLEKLDIRSTAILPIYTADEWYGYIGFDYLNQEKEWEEEDLNLLRSTADLIGASKMRGEITNSSNGAVFFDQITAEHMPAVYMVLDQEGRICRYNKNFEELIGYSHDELKGKEITELIQTEEKVHAGQFVDTVIKHGQDHNELNFLTKKGARVTLYMNGRCITEKNNLYLLLNGFEMSGSEIYKHGYENGIYRSETLVELQQERVERILILLNEYAGEQLEHSDDPIVQKLHLKNELQIQAIKQINNSLENIGDMQNISLKDCVAGIVQNLREKLEKDREIEVHLSVPEVYLIFDAALPFILIVNEILMNAFEHAFTDKKQGEIYIKIEHSDFELQAEIRDNGNGLPGREELLDSNTAGIKSIKKYLDQLNAEWTVDVENGVRYIIRFDTRKTY